MSDGSQVQPSDEAGRGNWLEAYLPQNELVPVQQRPSTLNYAAVRGILFRQRWLIAAVMALAVIASIVATMLATPMYEARSSVRIEPYGSYIVEGQNVDRGVAASQVYDLLSTQVEIITSRNLANAVAEELNLGERDDFLGADIDESRPPNMSDEEWRAVKQGIAADILHSSVSAEIAGNNWIINIRYRSDSPTIAAEMANAYLQAFVASDTRDSIENNEYAQEYLRERIDVTRQRLQEAEQAANSYARANGIIVQAGTGEDGEASATLTATNLANMNARTSAARAARIEAEQRWRAVQNVPTDQLAEVQNNSLLQGLIAERTAKQSELADLRQRYLEAHPQVRSVLAQIDTLNAQIERTAGDIRSTARTAYMVALGQEQALEQELASATGETLAEQDRQVEYGVLEREAQVLRDQLAALLTRFNEVSTAENVQSGRINPLDSATVPGAPYAPSLTRNLFVAIALGAALAGGLALLREVFDNKLRSFNEIEEKLGLPLLGHTPFVDSYEFGEEEPDRFSPLMEAYSSIRSTIEFKLPPGHNVIQMTSAFAAEGKTTTSMILGELFAGHGHKTLLVDVDLRRPSLSKLLGERPKVGLVEVLLGQADLQSAVVKGIHENLEILPITRSPDNPTQILASHQFREFINLARQKYSRVILDSSPLLGLADAPMLSGMVDGSVFVLEANRGDVGQLRSAIKRLQDNGGHVIGGILTKFKSLEAGESYDYQYSYYEYGKA